MPIRINEAHGGVDHDSDSVESRFDEYLDSVRHGASGGNHFFEEDTALSTRRRNLLSDEERAVGEHDSQ